MELVLNELSAIQVQSVREARLAMSNFIAVLTQAVTIGFERVVRASIDLGNYLLTNDYPVARWRNDPGVDHDEKTFFRLLTARFPIDRDLLELRNALLGCEYLYNERPCTGLGAADIIGTVCVSFALAEDWNGERVTVHHAFVDEDTGEYEEDQVAVLHASTPMHIASHQHWLLSRRREITSGADLFERRKDVLAKLVFCEEAAGQLVALTAGHVMLYPIAKKLFAFQDYASVWIDGPFDPAKLPMKVTPESAQTMKQYGDARVFTMPSGDLVSLPWHARLTGLPWRIHFGWDENNRTIVIGYIGDKLPTVKYPT